MNDCFLVKEVFRGGGGNPISRRGVTIRRWAALGDALIATVVADKIAALGHEVTFQSHPHTHPILRRCRSISHISGTKNFCHADMDSAYESDPNKATKHFHRMFVDRANQQLQNIGLSIGPPTNCRPRLTVTAEEREMAKAKFSQYPKPWVFVCPRSEHYVVRTVHDSVWVEMGPRIKGTKFWIGLHPAPTGFVDLRITQIDALIQWLSAADLLITVDTGPMHFAAALNVPVVAILQSSNPELHLNDQNDYVVVSNGLECLGCMKTLCPINGATPPCQGVNQDGIVAWSNARLQGRFSESVSAIIPTYHPDVENLNRCLRAVLPQVSEVIVTAAEDAIVPRGTLQHPKIRYVHAPGTNIGYSRNVNYGARWSNGKYLLILNDDVFLEPDTVGKLMAEMKSDTGIITHLLRYPDGTIYHAGVVRNPGDRDWHHIDHHRYMPTITQTTEMDNTCGASMLVSRQAFYDIGGFDEDFFLYCEDNDFAMRMRLHGWKILFTPHAGGTHLGSATSKKIAGVDKIMQESIALFHRKWDNYLRHNWNSKLGNFTYLKTV